MTTITHTVTNIQWVIKPRLINTITMSTALTKNIHFMLLKSMFMPMLIITATNTLIITTIMLMIIMLTTTMLTTTMLTTTATTRTTITIHSHRPISHLFLLGD